MPHGWATLGAEMRLAAAARWRSGSHLAEVFVDPTQGKVKSARLQIGIYFTA
jgi:hypothetical protein